MSSSSPSITAAIMRAIVRWRLTPMAAFWRCGRTCWRIWAPIYPISARQSPRIPETASRPASIMFLLLHIRVRCVLTNTLPTGPYRGAGRPEAIYRLERLLDVAAAEIGMDPIELRRRNLVPRTAMPYRTAANATYDSGDFAKILDNAVARRRLGRLPKAPRRGATTRSTARTRRSVPHRHDERTRAQRNGHC